ncbi:MAG: hypothetical protein M3Y77_13555 [Actinomycetota bacterium]|nr:hypothetical protein [Actinomycetota bacterium]
MADKQNDKPSLLARAWRGFRNMWGEQSELNDRRKNLNARQGNLGAGPGAGGGIGGGYGGGFGGGT